MNVTDEPEIDIANPRLSQLFLPVISAEDPLIDRAPLHFTTHAIKTHTVLYKIKMGTLTGSSSIFSTVIFRVSLNNPSMEYFYRNRIPVVQSGNTSCGFLCREIFSKRRRISTGDFGKLMMIKSSYSNNDDSGDGEDKEKSSLAAVTNEDTEEPRSGGKDFDSEDLPGSTSSRVYYYSSYCKCSYLFFFVCWNNVLHSFLQILN